MDKKWKSNTEEKWVKLTTAVAHPCGVPVFAPLGAFPPHFPWWYQWQGGSRGVLTLWGSAQRQAGALFRVEGNDRTEQSKCSTLVIVTLLHYCFKLKNANHCTARWSKCRENCTHSKVRKRKIINYIVLLPPQNNLFFFVFLSKFKRERDCAREWNFRN